MRKKTQVYTNIWLNIQCKGHINVIFLLDFVKLELGADQVAGELAHLLLLLVPGHPSAHSSQQLAPYRTTAARDAGRGSHSAELTQRIGTDTVSSALWCTTLCD